MKIDENSQITTIILEDNDKIRVVSNTKNYSQAVNISNNKGIISFENHNNKNVLKMCNQLLEIFKNNYAKVQQLNKYNSNKRINLYYSINNNYDSISLDISGISAFLFTLDSRCQDIFDYLRVMIMDYLINENYYRIEKKNNGVVHILPNDNRLEDTNIDVFSNDYQYLINSYNNEDNSELFSDLRRNIVSNVEDKLIKQINNNEYKGKMIDEYVREYKNMKKILKI